MAQDPASLHRRSIRSPRALATALLLFATRSVLAQDPEPHGHVAVAVRRFSVELASAPPATLPSRVELEILDGDGQSGPVGRCAAGLADPGRPAAERVHPLVVRAVDRRADSTPVPGLPLQFSGPGLVVEAPGLSTVTDAEGRAAVRYLLGAVPGIDEVVVASPQDPDLQPIRFRESAVLPRLETNFADLERRVFRVGSGDAMVRVRLTLPAAPKEAVIGVDTRIGIEWISDRGREDAERAGLYITPRERMTGDRGEGTFALIPDVEGTWRLRLSIPDFPQLEPADVTFTARERVAAGASVPRPALVQGSGQIATHDYPATFTLDGRPLAALMPEVRKALDEGFRLETFTFRIKSGPHSSGRSVYEFQSEGAQDWKTELTLTVLPDVAGRLRVRPAEGMQDALPHPFLVAAAANLVRGKEVRHIPLR